MRLNEVRFDNAVPVDGYGPGFFRIGGQVFRGALLITAAAVRDWGGYADSAALLALLALRGQVDVLFIGTGVETRHVPADLRQLLEEAGLGVEAMNSPAVCRTYNVLVAEGRRVAAAVLPV